MLSINTKSDKAPTVEATMAILQEQTQRFGIPVDYDRLLEYYSTYTIGGFRLIKAVEGYIGYKGTDKHMTDNTMKEFLSRNSVSTGLLLTAGGGYSMAEDSIKSAIDTGLYSKELCTVMQLYSKGSNMVRKVASFKSILAEVPISKVPTFDGHRMAILRPTWTRQNTGRLGASDPGIMNFAKEFSDYQTVPEGWIFIDTDSGQIEPRIICSRYINDVVLKNCIIAYNDAYFGYIHFCEYLSAEERANINTVIRPVEITEEQKMLRKTFKTYGNATMYGSTENRVNDIHKSKFIQYIGNHPKRLQWQEECRKQVDSGQRVFRTAFGTPIDITKGPSDGNYKDKTSDAYFAHLYFCALNNPVQGTAADLMRISIARGAALLREKTKYSFILAYVHDSGKYAIHESEYGKVGEDIKGITAYNVDDWIPIYADPKVGISVNKDFPRLF